ncbi:MAG: AMP-binding protein [Rhodoferax sp.]
MEIVSRQFPERVACILDNGQTITYSELLGAVSEFGTDLPRKSLLFIIGSNDLWTLTCYLAALESGAVALLLGVGIKEAQLNSLIDAYAPKFIFHSGQKFCQSDDWKLVREHGSYGLWRRPEQIAHKIHEELVLLLATSGSTGSPKLVRLSMENLISNAQSIGQYLEIDMEERAITSLPLNYSYGLSVLNSHLHVGASLVLTSRSMFDAEFWRLVSDYQVTSFAGVPYNYEMLLKLRFERMSIPSLRTVTQAGGRLDSEKIREIYKICSKKNMDFYPMYGQTEATARIAYLPKKDVLRKLGSIGVAIPGGRLWIESQDGQIVSEPRVTGELIYEGPNVSLGYAESRVDLGLGDENQGVLRTGDLGHVDEDGFFYVDGRKSRFLKIFGIRISLDAVEKILTAKGFTCAAHGLDDRLVLFIEQQPSELRVEDLRIELAETLGVNKAGVQILALAALPRLESGKVNYQWMNQLL